MGLASANRAAGRLSLRDVIIRRGRSQSGVARDRRQLRHNANAKGIYRFWNNPIWGAYFGLRSATEVSVAYLRLWRQIGIRILCSCYPNDANMLFFQRIDIYHTHTVHMSVLGLPIFTR
jgi:hypothetical protein